MYSTRIPLCRYNDFLICLGMVRPMQVDGIWDKRHLAFNVWLESPGHSTTRRFRALCQQCGFHRAGPAQEEDRRPTRAGHRPDSFLLNSPLVPWAARERPHLAPGLSPASLGCDHGPVVLDIPLAVAGKERVTRMAYSHAQGRLHAIRPDFPGVREAAAAVLQKACENQTLRAWLSSDQDTATMGTSEVQAVFNVLYAFRDDVSRVTGVRSTRTGRRRRRRLWPRSSRISKPWHGAPMSCGNGTRQRPGSTPRKRLPCCGTSDRWTPTCPLPRWRTCALHWTGSSTS